MAPEVALSKEALKWTRESASLPCQQTMYRVFPRRWNSPHHDYDARVGSTSVLLMAPSGDDSVSLLGEPKKSRVHIFTSRAEGCSLPPPRAGPDAHLAQPHQTSTPSSLSQAQSLEVRTLYSIFLGSNFSSKQES